MSLRTATLLSVAAILALTALPAPAGAIIDICTVNNSSCPPAVFPAPAPGNGFPPADVWGPYWNTNWYQYHPSGWYYHGPQLVTHTDLCNAPPYPITLEPGENLVPCAAALAAPNPPCPCPPTPEPIPIPMPGQIMATTAFWDGQDAYVLGGAIDLGGTEVADVTKFSRGMPQGPAWDPPYEPNQPGGEIQAAGSLPTARANQGLAYDPIGNKAYLFAGTNGGNMDNQIYMYDPVTQSSSVMPCTLPRNMDLMAGAWADGAAYAFGGRYVEGNGDTIPFEQHTSNEIYRLDPATCTVTLNPFYMPAGTNSPTPDGKRYGMTAITVGTDVFFWGGTFLDDVAGTTPTEASQGAYVYSPICSVVPPCPVPECAIMKFVPATGIITMLHQNVPYLCSNSSAVYDGRYVYIFQGAPPPGYYAGAYRFDPTAPVVVNVNPLWVSKLPMGTGNPNKGNDYMRGGAVLVSAVSTGCSAYLFGGLVDGIPVTSPPDGPLSDKITWFGKCRPQAVLAPTYGYTCPNYPIWFDARFSVPAEGDFRTVLWNWGDSTPTQTGFYFPHIPDWYDQYAFIPHTFTKEGNFVVTVTLTDFNGLKTSVQQTIPIRIDGVCTMYGGTPHNAPNHAYPDSEALDSDLDGIPDDSDNCPGTANNDQSNGDGDALGDACTPIEEQEETPIVTTPTVETPLPDSDKDGIADVRDNCPPMPNHDQSDMDTDFKGDVCDVDIDGDGVSNSGPPGAFLDNCPWYANPEQEDSNGDGAGDACGFLDSAAGKPAQAQPVAGASPTQPASLHWSMAVTMTVLAGIVTAGILVVVLRRTLRPSK